MGEENTTTITAESGSESTGNLLDTLDAQISELESNFDNVTNSADNNTDAGMKPEEASNDFAKQIEELRNDNQRLQEMVSRLIVINGARITSENTSKGVEAFPSSVEQTFETDSTTITPLKDIVLGS